MTCACVCVGGRERGGGRESMDYNAVVSFPWLNFKSKAPW